MAAAFHVYVINNLGDDTNLTAHCRSKETDLGTRVLEFGAAFDWDFVISIGHVAEYWCDLSWANSHGDFQVFYEPKDAVRCGDQKCYWRVDRDGLYLYIKIKDDYELQFRWP
ncbi:hypothetical protein BT93_H0219 [Corymbia citriodora subsp. variegata]|nr:hypothetical protein BT93_H0219 [Corymbia citriodora subsp. variegata]